MRDGHFPGPTDGAAKPRGTLRRKPAPKAAVMVAVLVCVGLAGLLMLGILRQMITRRAEVDLAGRTLQARWLAEAGLERAAARLAEDPGYSGETWQLPAGVLSGSEGATVHVQVRRVAGSPECLQVLVEADYPADPLYRVRMVKETVLEIPRKTASQR